MRSGVQQIITGITANGTYYSDPWTPNGLATLIGITYLVTTGGVPTGSVTLQGGWSNDPAAAWTDVDLSSVLAVGSLELLTTGGGDEILNVLFPVYRIKLDITGGGLAASDAYEFRSMES
jgi:hypothetical protein